MGLEANSSVLSTAIFIYHLLSHCQLLPSSFVSCTDGWSICSIRSSIFTLTFCTEGLHLQTLCSAQRSPLFFILSVFVELCIARTAFIAFGYQLLCYRPFSLHLCFFTICHQALFLLALQH
ncbi:hypothetical protein BDF19DRAFT_46584 [Syncephalis fuscata]|nr:hypothetical protein BDF19DRAFT_46584 [Syncephalis fuscata]